MADMESQRVRLVAQDGNIARMVSSWRLDCAPGSGPQDVCESSVAWGGLPLLLVGPIIKRATPSVLAIWVATISEAPVRGRVLRAPGDDITAADDQWSELSSTCERESWRLFDNLVFHMIEMRASGVEFPRDVVLGYDLEFAAPTFSVFSGGTGLVLKSEIAYGSSPFPTFLIGLQESWNRFNFLHASCRKFHGAGPDALDDLDRFVAGTHSRPGDRPSSLFLTGDQIYADDVHLDIFRAVVRTAVHLTGGTRETLADYREVGAGDGIPRSPFVRERGFTVDATRASHHLFALSEFAAMYVLSWSPALWGYADVPPLQAAHGSVRSARRLLANVTTYMMVDDHETTDDWPSSQAMLDRVREPGNDAGWIIANAKVAYGAFQLLGYDRALDRRIEAMILAGSTYMTPFNPFTEEDLRDPELRAYVHRMLQDARNSYVQSVLQVKNLGYVAPTSPPTIVLDTRTARDLSQPLPSLSDGELWHRSPRLMDGETLIWLHDVVSVALASRAGAGMPLVVLSPAPVIGFDVLEEIQDRPRFPTIDPEAWGHSSRGLYEFMSALLRARLRDVVFLSGDVHYAFAAEAYFRVDGHAPMRIVQLTSSALRNPASAELLVKLARRFAADKWMHAVIRELPDSDSIATNDEWETEIGGGLEEREIMNPPLRRVYAFGSPSVPVWIPDQRIRAAFSYRYLGVHGTACTYTQANGASVRLTWTPAEGFKAWQTLLGPGLDGTVSRCEFRQLLPSIGPAPTGRP